MSSCSFFFVHSYACFLVLPFPCALIGSAGAQAADGQYLVLDFDKTIKLNAGHSLKVTSTGTAFFNGSVRQIADIDGNLTNP